MKIHKIELENIHSLKGYHCIDFNNSQLKNTGIFAIIGPTGSGKSTLLDVVTLALFKQIARFRERITTTNIKDAGTVLTRATEKAFACVEYENNNKIYRSKFYVFKRTKNLTIEMELADAISNQIIETGLEKVPEANEKIIGLNYQQFVKSIILPQGGFANFLKADPAERATFLEKITGTEIFRTIGKRAFEINKLYEEAIKYQNQIVESINTLSQHQIEDTQNSIQSINQELSLLELQLSYCNQDINAKKTLISISKSINEYQNTLIIQENKLTELQPQIDKLNFHKKIQPFKTNIFVFDQLKNNISEHYTEIDNLTKKISENNIKLKNFETEHNRANKQIETLSFSLQQSQKNLQLANDLQTELKLIEQKFYDIQKIQSQIKNDIDKNTQDQNKQQKILENYELQKKQIQLWLQQNNSLITLNKEIESIKNAADVYENSKNQTQKSILSSNLNSIFSKFQWKDYLQIAQNEIEQNSIKINNLKQKITQTIDSSSISTISKEFSDKISTTKDILNFSQQYVQNQTNLTKNNQQIEQLNQDIKQLKSIVNDYLQKIEQSESELLNLRNKFNEENQTIKYEKDRENLKPQHPCPLCGSTHHPFVKNYSKPNIKYTSSLIEQKENELKHAQNQLKENEKQLEVKRHQLAEKEQENEKIQKNQNLLLSNFDSLKKNYFPNFEISNTLQIQSFLDNLQTQNLKFQENLSVQTQINELINNQNQLNSIISLIQTTLNHHTNLNSKLLPYKSYIVGINTIEQIIENLDKFDKNYQQKLLQSTEIEKNIELTIQKIDILKQNLLLLNNQQKEIQTNFFEIKNHYETSQSDYNQFIKNNFEAIEPNFFIKKIEQQLENTRAKYTEIQKNTAQIQTQNTHYQELINEKNQKLIEIKNQLDILSSELNEKINKIGFQSIDEAKLCLLDEDIAQKIENEQTFIIKEIQKTTEKINTFIEQKQQIERTIKSEKELNELEKDKNEIENKIKFKNQELGSLKEKLINNQNQTQQRQKELQKLEKLENLHKRWRQLNETIGDKEGKKFNEIAQKITLNELIRLANIHLSEFNNRYVLDYSQDNKNDLFICDKYLGYSIRSVRTLSGGETFLVSLSFALALSDLASQNVRIQTLFIDEGFATLDQEALDAALRYLEKLNTQYGRTIGIISHVVQIKERIHSKIVLNKTQNGFSTIEFD